MSGVTLTGWLLVVGPALFLVGAGAYFWTVMRAPRDQYLASIHGRPGPWRFANLCLLAGTVVTTAGLDIVPAQVADSGTALLAAAGAVSFSVAAVLWATSLVHRLAVVPTVASRFAATGIVDPAAEIADRWTGGLFSAFVVLGAAGLIAVGLALAVGGPVSSLVGAGTSVFALLVLGGFVIAGDVPPLTLFLPPLAIGLALLLGLH